ncbi:MAG: hypothetical protein JST93_37290 [Acidobacteria bacterium]|nr:hypothetical protein [Acidobacteriota bacterium]
MAKLEFQTLSVPDAEVIRAFETIAAKHEPDRTAHLKWRVLDSGPMAGCALQEARAHRELKGVLSLNAPVFRSAELELQSRQAPMNTVSVMLTRGTTGDAVFLNVPDNISDSEKNVSALAVREAFHKYDKSQALEQIHPLLAEFYDRREATLQRLEALHTKVLEDAVADRRKLEETFEAQKTQLKREFETKDMRREGEYSEKLRILEERQTELQRRESELDDRSNTHARRQLRAELKNDLKERSRSFSLSRDMKNKRMPIHSVFWALLFVTLGMLAYNLLYPSPDQWVWSVKLALSFAAFLASAIFYIRWMDRWAQNHADEEFRLKRLDLDIDRASWLVEMLLEWSEEKDGAIPREVVEAYRPRQTCAWLFPASGKRLLTVKA